MAEPKQSPGQERLVEVPLDEMTRRIKEVAAWWKNLAAAEIECMAPKAVAYGAADLKLMGAGLALLSPFSDETPERVHIELAIAFYALGKVARLFGAYEQGRLPSDDTWYDLGVYARMAQRVRDTGMWP